MLTVLASFYERSEHLTQHLSVEPGARDHWILPQMCSPLFPIYLCLVFAPRLSCHSIHRYQALALPIEELSRREERESKYTINQQTLQHLAGAIKAKVSVLLKQGAAATGKHS